MEEITGSPGSNNSGDIPSHKHTYLLLGILLFGFVGF